MTHSPEQAAEQYADKVMPVEDYFLTFTRPQINSAFLAGYKLAHENILKAKNNDENCTQSDK